MIVLNLYAIRSANPRVVKHLGDEAIGSLNDDYISMSVDHDTDVVCAWGCADHAPDIVCRMMRVLTVIGEYMPRIECLGTRKDGHPRHPLMLSYATPRKSFVWGL